MSSIIPDRILYDNVHEYRHYLSLLSHYCKVRKKKTNSCEIIVYRRVTGHDFLQSFNFETRFHTCIISTFYGIGYPCLLFCRRDTRVWSRYVLIRENGRSLQGPEILWAKKTGHRFLTAANNMLEKF